ncbi:TSUP family transporter [Granulicoccus sp. GXG6511]|uniref:TSUP family transporter n=1 Tax=Granulicoccus sp. GXG6511 TaxID=3381351 RepID=UPI003D7E73FB
MFDLHGISLAVVAGLVLAAFVAGWVDAVVGGGGLIQLPALLIGLPADTPTAHVLGTNKISSVAGTLTATITYARKIALHVPTLIPLVLSAFAGSAAGAAMARLIPKTALTPIVLVALIAVGLFTVFRPELGLVHQPRHAGFGEIVRTAAIGGSVGLYDGILGPGTGSFFVIAMVAVLGYGFLEASAKAKIANLTTNVAAISVFGLNGEILWGIGALMAVANLSGGWLGARTALRNGSAFVRKVFLIVIGALVLKLAYDTWRQFFG